MSKTYYGISTGETGEYGVGDLVESDRWDYEENGGGYVVDGEPCFNVITIDEDSYGQIRYVNI